MPTRRLTLSRDVLTELSAEDLATLRAAKAFPSGETALLCLCVLDETYITCLC